MVSRHGNPSLGLTYRFAAFVLKPPMTFLTIKDWRGTEWLRMDYQPTDGLVVVPNHISWFDPIAVSHVLWDNGRPPRFLAKEALFRMPFVGTVLKGADQIPVYRETSVAGDSVRAAVDAVGRGETVVVYPEGTITRDPDLWPMSGRTGAARIALLGDVPVIPLAHWGSQDIMGPYKPEFNILPRKVLHARVGPPVDLDDLRGLPLDAEILAEATDRILDAMTRQLEEIRGEAAPEQRLDFHEWRKEHTDHKKQED